MRKAFINTIEEMFGTLCFEKNISVDRVKPDRNY